MPIVGRPSQVEGAVPPSANVLVTGNMLPLSANTTINSLVISNTGIGSKDLNLAGHQLDVLSGGILRTGNNQDHASELNGTLTAGGTTPNSELQEMFGMDSTTVSIGANITDNPGVLAVGLTLSGGGNLNLSGTNTYTGQTFVSEGTLNIMTTASWPANADVTLSGGNMSNMTGSPLDVGDVVVAGGGIGGNNASLINADSYDVRSGSVSWVTGNGPFTKTTVGPASINGDNSSYSGNINVQQGLLQFSHRKSLGSGTVVVQPDGELGNFGEGDNFEGKITLNGGKLTLSGGTFARPVNFLGNVNVPVSSSIETNQTASTNLLTLLPSLAARLTKDGPAGTPPTGSSSVGNNSEFCSHRGTIEVLQTFVTDSQTDTLKLTGPQATSLSLTPSVILDASGFDGGVEFLNIDVYARRTIWVANGRRRRTTVPA